MAVAADVVARLPRRRSTGKGERGREHALLPEEEGHAVWPRGPQAAGGAEQPAPYGRDVQEDSGIVVVAVPPREPTVQPLCLGGKCMMVPRAAAPPRAAAAGQQAPVETAAGLSLWGGLRAALFGALHPRT